MADASEGRRTDRHDHEVNEAQDPERSSWMPWPRQHRLHRVTAGMLLLLLACTVILSPLWVLRVMYIPVQIPIAVGAGIALLSFRWVSGAMAQLGGMLENTTRGRFVQSSLGVSLAMFYVVALAVPVTAALLATGHLPPSGMHLSQKLGTGVEAPEVGQGFRYALAQALMFSTMLSFIGASFYIANRLRENGTPVDPKAFDPLLFWSGLWFRLGQAMLYTFCAFIYIWGTDIGPATQDLEAAGMHFRSLPLIGLFIGMFVRAAETLVLGLAERTFRAVEQMIGPNNRRRDAPAILPAAKAPPLAAAHDERPARTSSNITELDGQAR